MQRKNASQAHTHQIENNGFFSAGTFAAVAAVATVASNAVIVTVIASQLRVVVEIFSPSFAQSE